jgi:hypothetical protein
MRKITFQFHSGQHVASQKQPWLLTAVIWQLPQHTHISLSLLDVNGGRYLYQFLKNQHLHGLGEPEREPHVKMENATKLHFQDSIEKQESVLHYRQECFPRW